MRLSFSAREPSKKTFSRGMAYVSGAKNPRGSAQVDAIGIVVPVLRLVAHDEDAVPGRAASTQESVHALEHDRFVDSPAIDVTLQALPSQLAVRQHANCVAHRLLVA